MDFARYRIVLPMLLVGAFICTNTYSSDAEITYNYVDLAYVNTDVDDALPGVDVDGDGGAIRFSGSVHPNVHLFGEYSQVDLDFGVDVTTWQVGVGYNHSLADYTDLFATVAYADAEVEASGVSFDDDGYALGAGIRHMFVNDQIRASVLDGIELLGRLNYVDLDDSGDDTSGTAGILFHFDPVLAVGIEGTWSDDVTSYALGVRLMY